VTAIQRFGSALNVNVHFHTLVAQGVFVEDSEGGRHPRFPGGVVVDVLGNRGFVRNGLQLAVLADFLLA
jgi:hypothetical protein